MLTKWLSTAYRSSVDSNVTTDWFEAVDQEEFEDLFYPIMALGGIYRLVQTGNV